jgi:hypothetical protein
MDHKQRCHIMHTLYAVHPNLRVQVKAPLRVHYVKDNMLLNTTAPAGLLNEGLRLLQAA